MGNQIRPRKESKSSSVEITEPKTKHEIRKSTETTINVLPDGVTIIWLDENINKSMSTQKLLKSIHGSVIFFDKIDDFCRLMKSVSNKKSRIFLVISGRLSQSVLSDLSSYPMIDSVFIYCSKIDRYENLLSKFSTHLIDIVTRENELKLTLESELNKFQRRVSTVNFFAQNQIAVRDLTKDQASFVWFQLVKQVLTEARWNEADKKQMLSFCRDQYVRNVRKTKFFADIDKFEQTYRSLDALEWYTKQTFVYKLINSALRTENIVSLYMFRFYLSDLCRQLASVAQVWRERLKQTQTSSSFTVYRGCRMTSKELEYLSDSQNNKLFSINGFVSSTELKEVALQFMNRKAPREDSVKTLWTIRTDLNDETLVCASIARFSAHPNELEVLFNIGTTFQIDRIDKNDTEGFWSIEARTTNAANDVITQYMNLIQVDLDETSVEVVLGTLLLDMGEYQAAKFYFQHLIEQKTNPRDLAALHYNLGLTHIFQKDYSDAEANLFAAQKHTELLKSNVRMSIRLNNALGITRQANGEISQALQFYRGSEAFCKENLTADNIANAQTYTYIGQCYFIRAEYDDAIDYFRRAMDIVKSFYGYEHQRVAILLNEIGDAMIRKNQYEESFVILKEAERIFVSRLPRYHPCLAYCWSSMGILCVYMDDHTRAKEYHRKALDTYKRVLPANHPNISISEKNLKCARKEHLIERYIQICAQV